MRLETESRVPLDGQLKPQLELRLPDREPQPVDPPLARDGLVEHFRLDQPSLGPDASPRLQPGSPCLAEHPEDAQEVERPYLCAEEPVYDRRYVDLPDQRAAQLSERPFALSQPCVYALLWPKHVDDPMRVPSQPRLWLKRRAEDDFTPPGLASAAGRGHAEQELQTVAL